MRLDLVGGHRDLVVPQVVDLPGRGTALAVMRLRSRRGTQPARRLRRHLPGAPTQRACLAHEPDRTRDRAPRSAHSRWIRAGVTLGAPKPAKVRIAPTPRQNLGLDAARGALLSARSAFESKPRATASSFRRLVMRDRVGGERPAGLGWESRLMIAFAAVGVGVSAETPEARNRRQAAHPRQDAS